MLRHLSPIARKLYVAFTANCFRMNLQLLKNDIEKTGVIWVKRNSKANAGELVTFIKTYDPDDAASVEKLEREIDALIDSATEKI